MKWKGFGGGRGLHEGNKPEFEEWEQQGPQSIKVVFRPKLEMSSNGTHVKPHRLRRFVRLTVKYDVQM
jgi:hypothetical protein